MKSRKKYKRINSDAYKRRVNRNEFFNMVPAIIKYLDNADYRKAELLLSQVDESLYEEREYKYLLNRYNFLIGNYNYIYENESQNGKYSFKHIILALQNNDMDKIKMYYDEFLSTNIYLDYEYLTDFYKIFMRLRYLAMSKLNIPLPYDFEYLNYAFQQYYRYDEEVALNNIIERFGYNEAETTIDNMFNKDINIRDLFYKMKKIINEHKDEYVITGTSLLYIIHYPGVGINNYDYINVFVNLGTDDICKMVPSHVNGANKVIEYREEVNTVKLVKRLSQIDKFNQRYGKN